MNEHQSELVKWINEQRLAGHTDAEIQGAARSGGWGAEEVNKSLVQKVQPKWHARARFIVLPVILALIVFLDYIVANQMNEPGLELGAIGVGLALIVFLILDATGVILITFHRIGGYPLLIVANVLKLLGIESAVSFYFTGNSTKHTDWIYVIYGMAVILVALLVALARLEREKISSSVVKVQNRKVHLGPTHLRVSQITSQTQLMAIIWLGVFVVFNTLIFWNTFSSTEYTDWNPAIPYGGIILAVVGIVIMFRLSIQVGVWVTIFGMVFMLFFTGNISGLFTILWLLLIVGLYLISKMCIKQIHSSQAPVTQMGKV